MIMTQAAVHDRNMTATRVRKNRAGLPRLSWNINYRFILITVCIISSVVVTVLELAWNPL